MNIADNHTVPVQEDRRARGRLWAAEKPGIHGKVKARGNGRNMRRPLANATGLRIYFKRHSMYLASDTLSIADRLPTTPTACEPTQLPMNPSTSMGAC